MAQGIAATYLQLVRTAWAYVGSGALARLMRLRKGPIIAALYPIVMLLAQLVAAGLAGWALAALIALAAPAWLGALAGLALVPAILRWFRARDGKLYAYYLMHDYAYTAQSGGANPPELEARMAEFRDLDRRGAARARRRGAGGRPFLGRASGGLDPGRPDPRGRGAGGRVRRCRSCRSARWCRWSRSCRGPSGCAPTSHFLAARDEITWVDVTAPGDGCAFALCDPVAVSGVAPEGKRWPLVLSAAFTQTLSPERWRALRWRFFRLHFQYLCAFDRPGDYDYFRITAGPADAGRALSPAAPRRKAASKPRCRATPPWSHDRPAAAPAEARTAPRQGVAVALLASCSGPTSSRPSRPGSTAPGWPSSARRSSAPTCATTPRWSIWC